MMIQIECPECGKGLRARDELVGRRVACKECSHQFVVARPDAQPPPLRSKSEFEDDEAREANDETDHPKLGRFVDEYVSAISRHTRTIQIGCSVLMLVVGVVLILLIQITWLRWALGGLIVLGGLFEGIGLLVDVLRGSKAPLIRVVLYEHGFIYEHHKRHLCPWSEIAEINNLGLGLPPDAQPTSPKIVLRNGKSMDIDSQIANLDEFKSVLVENVDKSLSARIENELNEGRDIPFGEAVALTGDGIRIEGRQCTWDNVKAIQMRTVARKNEEYNPIVGGGAVGGLINLYYQRKQMTREMHVVLTNGKRLHVEESAISNLPILLNCLRTRFKIKVQDKSRKNE